MKKPIFSFKTDKGKKYNIYYVREPQVAWGQRAVVVQGYCTDACARNPKIVISKGLSEKDELNTIIEEFVHAFFFDKLEKEVRPLAKILTKFIYKKGWRKTKRQD